MQGVRVKSLMGEIRSHMLLAHKTKKIKRDKQYIYNG